jgi:hypothetical protein
LRSTIGLRQYCDSDAASDGNHGGEEVIRCVDRLDTGTRPGVFLKFAATPLVLGGWPLLFLGVLGSGGMEGAFFLEELVVVFDECDLTVEEEDGYSFWLSRSLDRLDRRD